jgi:hypothetical protein
MTCIAGLAKQSECSFAPLPVWLVRRWFIETIRGRADAKYAIEVKPSDWRQDGGQTTGGAIEALVFIEDSLLVGGAALAWARSLGHRGGPAARSSAHRLRTPPVSAWLP